MTRLPRLPREEWTDEVRDIFAYWEGEEARQNGSRSNTMHMLALHPALGKAVLDLGKYFMLDSTLSARQIKLIILRVAHRHGATYQWTHNALGALQVGISEDEIAAVRQGAEHAIWKPDDKALLAAVDLICAGGRIEEPVWTALVSRFGKRFVLDLVHGTGYFAMIALGLIATELELEPDFAAFSKNRAKD